METVIGVEGSIILPTEVSDPVVYKLVRVEGDGRLVPATDDELMELEDERNELHLVDIGQTVGCIPGEDLSNDGRVEPPTSDHFEGAEELLGDHRIGMHLADTVQTVACIPNEDLSMKKPLIEDSCLAQSQNPDIGVEKFNAGPELLESVSSLAQSSNETRNEDSLFGDCLSKQEEPMKTSSLVPAVCANLIPNFPKSKEDICLDDLSIRDLHATFKATFGRETSVKDKLWLKRRIAMGLTNSCDVSTATFTIKGSKLVKVDEEIERGMDQFLSNDLVLGDVDDNSRGSSVSHDNTLEDNQMSGKRSKNSLTECSDKSEDLHSEQKTAKRVRKPTRRYIEEFSEVEFREHNEKFLSSVKIHEHDQLHLKTILKPLEKRQSDERPIVTRLDSLGGSGVQVPYVSRIRRSRPRKNFMALTKFHPSGMTSKLELHGAHVSQSDEKSGDKTLSTSKQLHQPLISEQEMNKRGSIVGMIAEDQHMDSSRNSSNDNIVTVPTTKGGVRRKHHRAWSLSEVMKLVEGVARYGAGRWSEIKRVSFASYAYRTSVDLKDKWRNLLRASSTQSAQLPSEGMNSRKHASVPIPAPILARVRELAELHAQAPNFISSKAANPVVTFAREKKSGYL